MSYFLEQLCGEMGRVDEALDNQIRPYDLEPPGSLFDAIFASLRMEIPRVSGKGGIQASWRAICKLNTAGPDYMPGDGPNGSTR